MKKNNSQHNSPFTIYHSQLKNIPELRFPEFKNAGEWEEKKISDILNYKRPDNYIVTNTQYAKEGTPVLTANKAFVLGYTDEKEGIYKKTPVIIFDDFTTDMKFVDFPFKIKSSAIKILKEKPNNNLKFIYELIRQIKFDASQHKRYYISEYQNLLIPVPSQSEQQKIAGLLSSLDEHIEAENKILDTLKQHKKGLMQKLFPQEGKKIPELRFPEFKNDSEWEVEPFGSIYSFRTTNSFSRNKLNYKKGKVKNIHYGDIHTKFSILFDIAKENVPYVNSDIPIDNIDKDDYCIEGDLVFADASEDLEDIGKSIEIVNVNNEKLLSGLHTFLARQIYNKLIIGFGGYLFKSDIIRNQIKNEAQGAKILGISKKRISTIKIPYPKNKKEQQKIADTLSRIDELIKAQTGKIEQLKQHKKGLMQKVFPKM